MSEMLTEIRQALAELELVSHASTRNYEGRSRPSSDEDIGGKRPPGSDQEFAGKDQLEWEALKASYHWRTVAHYRQRLRNISRDEEALRPVLAEIRETVKAWRQAPIPQGQEPEFGSPQWKRYVAESPLDGGELARKFNVTRQYISQVRRGYR